MLRNWKPTASSMRRHTTRMSGGSSVMQPYGSWSSADELHLVGAGGEHRLHARQHVGAAADHHHVRGVLRGCRGVAHVRCHTVISRSAPSDDLDRSATNFAGFLRCAPPSGDVARQATLRVTRRGSGRAGRASESVARTEHAGPAANRRPRWWCPVLRLELEAQAQAEERAARLDERQAVAERDAALPGDQVLIADRVLGVEDVEQVDEDLGRGPSDGQRRTGPAGRSGPTRGC